MHSQRGNGRDPVRTTAEVAAAVTGSNDSSGLPWMLRALSQIISLVLTVFHFLQTWDWVAKLATPQLGCRDTVAAEPEAEAALVVAQVMTCDIAADTKQLPSSCNEDKSSSVLQDVEALQQQLQEAQQAAAAAHSRAEQLADELQRSQQCTTEAQQKAVRLEDLYQQVRGNSEHECMEFLCMDAGRCHMHTRCLHACLQHIGGCPVCLLCS
jgi:hypothetical protein